jgi:hypothetical protein
MTLNPIYLPRQQVLSLMPADVIEYHLYVSVRLSVREPFITAGTPGLDLQGLIRLDKAVVVEPSRIST